jgi:hypothetical protein
LAYVSDKGNRDRVAEAVEALVASVTGPGDRFLVFEATDGDGKFGYVFLRMRDGMVHLHQVEATAINPVPVFYARLTEDSLRENVASLEPQRLPLEEPISADDTARIAERLIRIFIDAYGLPGGIAVTVRLDLDPDRPPEGWGLAVEWTLNTIYVGVMVVSAVLALFLGVSLLLGEEQDGRVLFSFGTGVYVAITLWFAATAIVMGVLLALTQLEDRFQTSWHTYGTLAVLAIFLFAGAIVWYFISLSVPRYEVQINAEAQTIVRRQLSVLPLGHESVEIAFDDMERVNGVFRTRLFGGRRGPDSIGRDYVIWIIKLDGTRVELAGNFYNDPDKRGEVPDVALDLANEIAEVSMTPLTLNQ